MKKYHIKIKDKIVHRTDNVKEALRIVAKIYRTDQIGGNFHSDGEVSLHGGRLGKWWNE